MTLLTSTKHALEASVSTYRRERSFIIGREYNLDIRQYKISKSLEFHSPMACSRAPRFRSSAVRFLHREAASRSPNTAHFDSTFHANMTREFIPLASTFPEIPRSPTVPVSRFETLPRAPSIRADNPVPNRDRPTTPSKRLEHQRNSSVNHR